MKDENTTATVAEPSLLFTMESVQAIQIVKDRAGEILRELAKERALGDGRSLVKVDDVLASIAEALRETIEDTKPEQDS